MTSASPGRLPCIPVLLKRLDLQQRWCETQITVVPETRAPDNVLQIQNCVSSDAVVDLATPFITSMNIHDICVVLRVLKRFRDDPQPKLMDAIADQILKQKTGLQPKNITHIFHVFARLGYANETLFEAMAQQAMLPFQLEAFSHRDVSVMLHSIGCIVRDHARKRKVDMVDVEFRQLVLPAVDTQHDRTIFPSQSKFLDLLLRRFVTVTEYDTVAGWQVANTIYGAAAVRCLDPELIQKLVNMAIHGPIFRELPSQGLCSIINCFGYLNHYDPEALELILSQILHPARLPLFAESGLTTVVQGLAMLRYNNRQNISTLATEILRPWRLRKYTNKELTGLWFYFGRLGIRDTTFLDPLMKEAMQTDRLQSLSSKGLFSVLMSMAHLKYRNNDFLHAFVEEIASDRRLTSTSEKDYPGYIWCFGQLQYNNEQDVKKVMMSLLSTNRLERLPGKTLASICYGFSQCSVADSGCIQTILKEISKPERLKELSSHSLASLVHSLGRMEQPMCPLMEAVLHEALSVERVSQYTEYGLVAVVHGLTNLRVTDHAIIKPLLSEIRKPERIAAYKPGALTCLVFGLSALRNRDTDLLARLAEEIVKTEKLKVLSGSGVTSLVVNFAELKFDNLDVIERLLSVIVNSSELRHMSNATLAAFVYALGRLHYSNSKEILMPIIDELTKRRAAFKNHELGAVINGLGHMGITFKDFYTMQHILAESLDSGRISSYTIKELGRISSGLSLLDYSSPDMKPLLERLLRPDIFENLDFKDLAGSIYALGHAGMRSKEVLTRLKNEIFRRGRRIETSQRYLALLIQGIGPMCQTKDYSFGQMLLELVHYQYGHDIDELTNQNLTAMLYGLGQIGVENKPMLYAFVANSIKTRRLQQYTVHGLATLVFGLGQFRFRDEKALLPVLKEVCGVHRLKYFSNRQLVGNIFSFCNMEITSEELLDPLVKAATLPTQLARCGGSDLSMIFFSLVKIKPRNQTHLVNALNEIKYPERLNSLGDLELNAILFSMTGLREYARSPDVLRPVIDQLSLPGRLEKMNGDILGNILYSLGRLDFIPVDFLDLVAAEASKPLKLMNLSETALCNIINTVGKAKYDNRGFVNALLEEAMRGTRLRLYHEGHIMNITYALGSLRFCHPRFISFMERVLSDVREVNKFQPRTLLMIMHAYQLLGVGSQQTVANVTKSVLSNTDRLSQLTDVQLSSLMDTLGNIQKNDKRKQESMDRTDLL